MRPEGPKYRDGRDAAPNDKIRHISDSRYREGWSVHAIEKLLEQWVARLKNARGIITLNTFPVRDLEKIEEPKPPNHLRLVDKP